MRKYLHFLFSLCVVLVFTSISLFAEVPVLSEPEDGVSCISQKPILKWNQIFSGQSFSIQVSKNSDFSNPVVNLSGIAISALSQDVLLPESSTLYYWRVGVVPTPGANPNWSDPRSFTTVPASPILTSPANNATCIDIDPLLSWNAPQGAVLGYEIQISTQQDFNTVLLDSNNITNTAFKYRLPNFLGTYYWRVRANYSTCPSDWSDSRSLTTQISYPTGLLPINGSVGQDLTVSLKWNPASGNTFDVQVADNPNFTGTLILDQSNLSGTTIDVNFATNNKLYYWRMRAKSGTCLSPWTDINTIRTKYVKTTLLLPVDKQTCVSTKYNLFDWNDLAPIKSWRILIAKDAEFKQVLYDIDTIKKSEINVELTGSITNYYWKVMGSDNVNTGDWSDVRTFTSTVFAPKPTDPAPDTKNFMLSGTIKWTNVTAITKFILQVATDTTFTDIVLNKEQADKSYSLFATPLKLFGKKYFWRLKTLYDACESDWSTVNSFTTIQGYPDLVSPANNQKNVNPKAVFTWTKADSTTYYDIRFSSSPDFSTVLGIGLNNIANTTISINNLNENTTYYWSVRSHTKWGDSPWSPPYSFTTGVKGTSKPTLIFPNDGNTLVGVKDSLVWDRDEFAEKYRLQMSLQSDMSTFLVDTLIVADTSFRYDKFEFYKDYYWRVSAINTTTTSPFSDTWYFRTQPLAPSKAVELVSPIDKSEEINPIDLVLTWKDMPEVSKYEGAYKLEISTDQTYSDKSKSWLFDKIYFNYWKGSVLSKDSTYFWRVMGYNFSGEGPWSAPFSLKTLTSIGIEDENLAKDITIFENPVADNLKISGTFEAGTYSINIYNQSGNLQLASNLDLKFDSNLNTIDIAEIDVSKLASGVYFVELKSKNSRFLKFIKK